MMRDYADLALPGGSVGTHSLAPVPAVKWHINTAFGGEASMLKYIVKSNIQWKQTLGSLDPPPHKQGNEEIINGVHFGYFNLEF